MEVEAAGKTPSGHAQKAPPEELVGRKRGILYPVLGLAGGGNCVLVIIYLVKRGYTHKELASSTQAFGVLGKQEAIIQLVLNSLFNAHSELQLKKVS